MGGARGRAESDTAKEMATHSSILAWRIPGTGEPGGLPSMGPTKMSSWERVPGGKQDPGRCQGSLKVGGPFTLGPGLWGKKTRLVVSPEAGLFPGRAEVTHGQVKHPGQTHSWSRH